MTALYSNDLCDLKCLRKTIGDIRYEKLLPVVCYFNQSQLHILMISRFHIIKEFPKLAKSPCYRLGILLKFCNFHNVVEKLNNFICRLTILG